MSSGVATILPLMYALKDDGSVWGWGPVTGANMNATQVGHVSEPVPIVGIDLAPIGDVVQIDQSSNSGRWGCALTGGGTVLCWGWLPDSFERQYADVAVELSFPEIASPITELAVGAESMCLLDGDGAVWCWGSNQSGQLGGDTIDTSDPRFGLASVAGLPKRATHIASGGGIHACAILEDSTLWCWGGNGFGQLGVGDTADRPRPIQVLFPG
jgi:alpha-tubulin suppressor-like RCC1 family protein